MAELHPSPQDWYATLADLHQGLQRNPSGARGYAQAIDLVREYIGSNSSERPS